MNTFCLSQQVEATWWSPCRVTCSPTVNRVTVLLPEAAGCRLANKTAIKKGKQMKLRYSMCGFAIICLHRHFFACLFVWFFLREHMWDQQNDLGSGSFSSCCSGAFNSYPMIILGRSHTELIWFCHL